MRILQVIHGYPMRYNAGSEVYTQGLAKALAERNEVHVYTRQEKRLPSRIYYPARGGPIRSQNHSSRNQHGEGA